MGRLKEGTTMTLTQLMAKIDEVQEMIDKRAATPKKFRVRWDTYNMQQLRDLLEDSLRIAQALPV